MMHPVAGIIGHKLDAGLAHVGGHHDRVFAQAGTADHLKEVAVQVHGVGHRAVVEIIDPHPLALLHQQVIRIGESFTVDGPIGRHHPTG